MDDEDYEKEVLRMHMPEIYRETIHFPLVRVATGLMVVITLLILTLFATQLSGNPIGDFPMPFWLYLVMVLSSALVTFILANLIRLTIGITPHYITVAFGIFKQTISWENVSGCYVAWGSSAPDYWSWGVSVRRVSGKWRRGFSVSGCSNVVLQREEGMFKEFAFSTKDPERVMDIIRQRVWK
jgi:hypothetical protein